MKIRVLCGLALGLVLVFGSGGQAYSDLKTAQTAQAGPGDTPRPVPEPIKPTR
ncbi:MAG: hypothetical protein AAFR20_06320 [Pseudomonadota bacterium]